MSPYKINPKLDKLLSIDELVKKLDEQKYITFIKENFINLVRENKITAWDCKDGELRFLYNENR